MSFNFCTLVASEEMNWQLVEPVGVQNKDVGSASQTLLTGIRLLLQCRLEKEGQTEMNSSSQSIHNGLPL